MNDVFIRTLEEFRLVLDDVRTDPNYLLDMLESSARRRTFSAQVDLED